MGKTKIKLIDDSQPEVEEKKVKKSKNPVIESGNQVEVAAVGDPEESSQASTASEFTSEDAPEIPEGQDPQGDEAAKTKIEKTESTEPQATPKPQTRATKKQRSKKYLQSLENIDRTQKYPLPQAIELVQKTSYSKFPGTVEVHINTNQGNLRGLVTLPHFTGKKLTILAFGKGAKEAGADIIGDDSSIEEITKGKINFDVIVSTPEWMPKLAKAAKVLGPRGLMPNPKSGTVSDNLEKTISELLGGKTEYKTESKGKVIHLGVGKISQPVEELQANIESLYTTIGKSRISQITVAATMSPGVKVELSSI